jgi:hypothetical protein
MPRTVRNGQGRGFAIQQRLLKEFKTTRERYVSLKRVVTVVGKKVGEPMGRFAGQKCQLQECNEN